MNVYNWAGLEVTQEEWDNVCHGFGRKLDRWSAVKEVVTVSKDLFDRLPKLLDVGDTPFDELPARLHRTIFVAVRKGKKYLVNTEGYSYCRYVALLKVDVDL